MTISGGSRKSAEAFRTISEVADALRLPQHVLRFWETRFVQIKPLKRAGGRRYYRPEDIELLGAIRQLLYGEGYTIKGVQRILREQGPRAVAMLARQVDPQALTWPEASSGPDAGEEIEAAPDFDPDASSPDFTGGERPEGDPIVFAAGADDCIAAAGQTTVQATPYTAGSASDIARLRSVLAELAECRRLLEIARS